MAGKKNKAITIAKKLVKELEKKGFTLKEAYVYGSYAKGTFNQYSDIDVALVSDKFSGFRMRDRDLIRDIYLKLDSRLEPMPFRPEDFEPWHPLVYEILATGIKIK